jgi:hypothetical protein
MNINKVLNDNILYIYIFFIVIIFFIYGLTISEIIDYIFPIQDDLKNNYYIALEIIGEIGVAYLIYFCFKNYIDNIINSLFIKISKKTPFYLNDLLLIAFSLGIFKHLEKSSNKLNYMKNQILGYMNIKI